MIRLEIRSWSSPDVEMRRWVPEDPEDVYFLLELEIGEAGQPGADLFQAMVATPTGLRRWGSHSDRPLISDRALFVLKEFSWSIVESEVRRVVDHCAAETFGESVLRLQRYFEWEYEDYRAPPPEPPKSRRRRR